MVGKKSITGFIFFVRMILEHIKLLYENLFLNTINYSGLWRGGVGFLWSLGGWFPMFSVSYSKNYQTSAELFYTLYSVA